MAQIYIHCGLHKTGTSALQAVLAKHADKLRTAGFLYPRAARVGSGTVAHHNLAWQISRDRRYNSGFGGVEDLTNELRAFDGTAIVSSEDFESTLGRPELLEPLVQCALDVRKELVLVLYVRNQVSYFESLFQEMLNYGFGEECMLLFDELLKYRRLRMKDWVFHFDYLRIVNDLIISTPSARVILRNYHTLLQNSLVADFMSLIGADPALIGSDIHFRTNKRDTLSTSLLLFYQNRIDSLYYRNRVGFSPKSPAERIIDRLGPKINHLELTIGPQLRKAILETFSDGNLRICQEHKIPSRELTQEKTKYNDTVPVMRFERFFSFETQCAIKKVERFLDTHLDQPDEFRTSVIDAAVRDLEMWWTGAAAMSASRPELR
jgi:hypothetical protein